MIGQKKIREQLDILIEAANKKKKPLPHMMFQGPAGYGKTYFAKNIAKRTGNNMHQINAAGVKDHLHAQLYFHAIEYGDIVFMDEIHALKSKGQDILLTIAEEFYIHDDLSGRIDLPAFTLIGATTSTVSQPLLQRFRHVFTMEEYTDKEIAEIIRLTADERKVKITPDKLSGYARGNPRRAKHLLDWVMDYAIAKDIGNLDSVVEECMRYKNLYPGGFSKDDLRYLEYLKNQKRVQGLNTISSAINIDPKKITDEIEPFLLNRGLIAKHPRGRIVVMSRINEWESIDNPK